MKVVWKFALELEEGVQEIDMPMWSDVVHVAMQHGKPTVWAVVTNPEPKTRRQFIVAPTGSELMEAEQLAYLGAAFDGPFVWHVFGEET